MGGLQKKSLLALRGSSNHLWKEKDEAPAPLLARTTKDFIKVKGWGEGREKKEKKKNRTLPR